MFACLNTLLCRVLPMLAVVMLTAGPASSAAEAAYRGRAAERARSQDESARCVAESASQANSPIAPDSPPSGDKRSKHETNGATAYLVPAVAKPSESKSTDYLAACTMGQSSSRVSQPRYVSLTAQTETPLKQLHCPAYLAQAPPLS